jgi:hypothetical protein
LELLATGADDAVLAFRRPGVSASDDVFVFINFDARAREVRVPEGRGANELEDVLNAAAVPRSASGGSIKIPAHQALVLVVRAGG